MQHQTADHDRLPLHHKVVYGLGGLANNLLSAAVGSMIIVLNLGLGMNPALVGLLASLPRLTDALTDPLMGYISDRTHSRWGRRRPYIFCGAIAAGLMLVVLWQLPHGQSESYYFWYFLIASFAFYLAYTVFATPWVALGYELTADYHERTRLMAVQSFFAQFAWIIAPWFLWFMQNEAWFDNVVDGASTLSVLLACLVVGMGILPALVLRERHGAAAARAGAQLATFKDQLLGFFRDFSEALKFRPFLYLCGATFLVFNGFQMVGAFQTYVIIFYLYGGDQAQGAAMAGWAGSVSAVAAFVVIFAAAKLSERFGKRRAFFICITISIVGYLAKWLCYSPANPWLILLPMPLIAFGLGSLFTLMGAMIADVCDMDELESGQRREGMFGSIYWWVVKLGMAAALAAGGFVLNATGFDMALGGAQSVDTLFAMRLLDVSMPALASALAIWLVWKYPLSEQRAYQIRDRLEQRRDSRDDGVFEGAVASAG